MTRHASRSARNRKALANFDAMLAKRHDAPVVSVSVTISAAISTCGRPDGSVSFYRDVLEEVQKQIAAALDGTGARPRDLIDEWTVNDVLDE